MSTTTTNQNRPQYTNDINVADISQLPEDTVSCIRFSNNQASKLFATSDWAGKVRLYDLQGNALAQKMIFDCQSPVLEIYWMMDNSIIFAACIDGGVRALNVSNGQVQKILEDPGLITFLYMQNSGMELLLTFSTNQTLKIWKIGTQQPMAQIQLNHVPMKADLGYNGYFVIGFSDFKYSITTLELLNKAQLKLEYKTCELGTPINCIGISKSTPKFAIGTIDGRIIIYNFKNSASAIVPVSSAIQYKAHRSGDSKEEKNRGYNKPPMELYPVNGIGFHLQEPNIMFSIGNDGSTYFWNLECRGKNSDFSQGGTPLTAADFSPDGQAFVYAVGYDWSYGIWGVENVNYRPVVSMYALKENDLRKKS